MDASACYGENAWDEGWDEREMGEDVIREDGGKWVWI